MQKVDCSRIAALLGEDKQYREIAQQLSCSVSTVARWAKILDIQRPERRNKKDWVAIRRFYDSGHTYAECVARFGVNSQTWSNAIKRGDIVPRKRGGPVSRGGYNQHVRRKKLLDEVCIGCGITEWRGKPITLELHHKDGNPANNVLENVEFLCPNCHSQTDNHRGKNRGNGRKARGMI